MPTYVMLSNLGPDGWATLRQNPDRLLEVNREVEQMGLKVIGQYALLGEFDFLNILEAPNEETMARAAVMLAARGTLRTRTLQAIPIEDFLESLRKDAG